MNNLNLNQLFNQNQIEQLILGRTSQALDLNCSSVSRTHALIQQTDKGTFQISDLNSLNGVLVNGAQVTSQTLSHGDVVTLGNISFTVETASISSEVIHSMAEWIEASPSVQKHLGW